MDRYLDRMRQLKGVRSRMPDEHDCSIVTDVKQVRESESPGFEALPVDRAKQSGSLFPSAADRPIAERRFDPLIDGDSFEVSAESLSFSIP